MQEEIGLWNIVKINYEKLIILRGGIMQQAIFDIIAIIFSGIVGFGGGYLLRYSQELSNIEDTEDESVGEKIAKT